MEKKYREESGLFFRGVNQNTKKIDNICFEELTLQEREEYMKDKSIDWYKAMIQQLSNTLNKVSEEKHILRETINAIRDDDPKVNELFKQAFGL